MRSRASLVAVLALAIAAGPSVPALAHDKRFKTRVTASEPSPFSYEGEVISRSRACERKRKLQVWIDGPEDDDEMVGEFRANRDGSWSYGFFGQEYYFVALRVKKTPGDHKHVCKPDRSPTV